MAYNPRNDTRRVQAQLRASQKDAVKSVARQYEQTQARLTNNWTQTRREILARQQAGHPTGWTDVRQLPQTRHMFNTYADDLTRNIPATRAAIQAATQQAQQLAEKHARDTLLKLGENASTIRIPDHLPDMAELTRLQTVRAVTSVDRLTGKFEHYVDAELLDSPVLARAFGQACKDTFAGAYTALRTEQMATFRAATSDMFDRSQTVDRWRWVARLDERTCAFCWAMHGEIFEANEILDSHENCYCIQEAYVEGVDPGPAGVDLFKTLTDEEQTQILGPAAKAALDDRQFHLYQVVTAGPAGSSASLRDLVGADAAKGYVRDAIRRGRS